MSKVLVNFIQDRSGSMQSVWDETLSGFKSFVNELRDKAKQDGVEYLLSLTTFDTLVETPVIGMPIGKVDADILKKHGPRGGTALYDAVGVTIRNTDDNRHGAEKVIVVVVTDGHENSSREWTKDMLHTAVDERLNRGDWTFTYLGTQPETWDDAAAFGVGSGAVRSYTPAMASAAYAAVASATCLMAASPQKGTRNLMDDFLAPEAAAAAGMGKKPEEAPKPPAPKPSMWRGTEPPAAGSFFESIFKKPGPPDPKPKKESGGWRR